MASPLTLEGPPERQAEAPRPPETSRRRTGRRHHRRPVPLGMTPDFTLRLHLSLSHSHTMSLETLCL